MMMTDFLCSRDIFSLTGDWRKTCAVSIEATERCRSLESFRIKIGLAVAYQHTITFISETGFLVVQTKAGYQPLLLIYLLKNPRIRHLKG